MKSPILAMNIQAETENPFPEPFKSTMGVAEWRGLGDQFSLSQFGVNLEVIHPGGQSALRHWHTKSDEFVYILEGKLTLVTDAGETLMLPGMCVGFKAGDSNGHHLINNTTKLAKFLVIGTRVEGDKVHYSDDDFQWLEKDGRYVAAKRDGTPYE